MIESVYIHIPFCNKICAYCDFCKLLYNDKIVNKYLDVLKEEIYSNYNKDKINTIYIGGGTPSSLSINQLEKLFNIISIFNCNDNLEFTVECNFDSITLEKLELFKKYGVNRLSFGLESIVDKNLKILEREESKSRVKKVISWCRDMGFNNINIDLMYAIPGEDLKDLEEDINFILSLDVEHISTYSLMIEEHTKLYINNTKYIEEEKDLEMYNFINSKLKTYNHYEISNFSKDGYESKHNMCYWKNNNYYGFGLGASSYIGNRRINNTRSITRYLKNIYINEIEKLNKYDIMSYEMILGLRMSYGVNKNSFYKKYNTNIEDEFDIKFLIEKGLIKEKDNNIYIPYDNWYISNEILINFIKE